MIKRIQYGSTRFLFWSLLLLAISVSGLRFALSGSNIFKAEIESQLSHYLATPVSIAKIQGVLNGFRPELALLDIKIQSQQGHKTAIQLQEIHLGINLLNSLTSPLLESLQITIMRAKLSIKRLKSGGITIQGLPSIEDEQNPGWLMQGKQYKLIDSEINWHDEKRNAQAVQFKHVNISIQNNAQRHKIFITMDLPETLGKSLNLAMNFTGDMFVPESVNARLFVQGKGIQLAKIITGDLPFGFSITQGHGDFSIWSSWQATQMTKMSGNILINDTEIKNKQNNRFPIDQLKLQLKLQKQQQQWQLAIQNAHLSSQQVVLDIATLAIALEHNENGELSHIAVNSPRLDLGELNSIFTRNKVLAPKIHRQLQTLAIKGQMRNLLFLAKPLEETFSISAQLDQIHTKPLDDIPGIKGLSLFIKGTEKQGNILVSSGQLTLKSPRQFRRPLRFNHALGELQWQQQADSWVLSSPLLALHTRDIKTKNKLQLTLPKDKQPVHLNLQSYFYQGRDVSQIRHYLPVGIIDSPSLVDWLDHAFLSGSITQGGVLFHGALKDYPFTDSSGVFEVLFDAKNVDLHYADNWQPVENLTAEIRFFSEDMEVNIHHGLANQTSIKKTSIKMNSLTSSNTLSIKGDINGDLSQAIGFLKQTPYKEQITTVNKLLDIQGLFSAKIDLEIPLNDTPAKIDITAVPQNARLHITAADIPVTDINGQLHITDKGIFSENLSAHILGFPVKTIINSQEQNTRVLLSGQTDSKHLSDQFSSPFWSYFEGTSRYQLRLNVPGDLNKTTKLQLITNLEGMTIDFPSLSKTSDQAYPFSLDLSIDTSGINALNVNYKNPLRPENSLDINLKKILPHWQGLIHSPYASGSVFIPVDLNKRSKITLLFDEMDLSALENSQLKPDNSTFSFDDFPAIHLESQALYWQNDNLGKLTLQTQTTQNGLDIERLSIISATDELNLTGHWQPANPGSKTTINGNLLSINFGHLLHRLKLSKNLVDSTADLQFSLNWPGAPMDISRQSITGEVQAYLTNGRILGVEPGLGRVLGALDTWKLLKRLRFDFSDITDEGLSFTEITAKTSINQGLVSTKNFHIDAMPAEISLAGMTHLDTREIDLQATVLPKFPITGTIIGNVANSVTKTLVGDQHAGGLILSLLYEIQGTWEQFTVNRKFSPVLRAPDNNKVPTTSQSKPK